MMTEQEYEDNLAELKRRLNFAEQYGDAGSTSLLKFAIACAEDSKRLQWMIDNEGEVSHGEPGVWHVFHHGEYHEYQCDNPREAIDAAMK